MTQLTQLLLFLLSGLVAVTIIDTMGAWASRRFNFNYTYLGILQFAVYVFISLFICRMIGLRMAFLVNLLIAFYDATVGLHLSLKCKANFKLKTVELKEITTSESLVAMLIFSIISTLIGYSVA